MGLKKGERKQQILLAAIRLMSESGYEPVSIKMIADAVALQPGSVSSHFPRKEDILDSIIDFANERLSVRLCTQQEVLSAMKTMSPREFFLQDTMHYQDEDDTLRMQLYRILFIELFNNRKIAEYMKSFFFVTPTVNRMKELETMAACGALPSSDMEALSIVWQYTSIMFGYLCSHYYMGVRNEAYFEMVDFFIEQAARGITPIEDRGEIYTSPAEMHPFTSSGDYSDPTLPTKLRLMLATYDLMDEIGGDKITMRLLSKRIGLQLNSIYNHYESKDDLIELVSTNLVQHSEIPTDRLKTDFMEAVKNGNQGRMIRTLSIFNPPFQVERLCKGYSVIFKEQYRNPILRDFYWGKIHRDIHTLADTFAELAAEKKIPSCDSLKIATAYIYTMAAINIDSTAFQQSVQHTEHLRKAAGRWLLGLLLGK